MSSAKDTEEQAAHWLLRQEEADWSAADQAAFDAWLEASTLHRVAFYRLEHGWRRADRLAALKHAVMPDRRFRPSRLRIGQMAAAAAIAGALLVGAFILRQGPQVSSRTYVTELGARSSYPLDDGSQVELNTDSQLRTELSAKSRSAWLGKGEVYFQIAHDPSRPFVIHAGKQLVTVLGTKFSVRLEGERVTVAVLEGRVQVGAAKSSPAIATPGDVVLTQGDEAVVQHGPVDRVAASLRWREGLLSFDRASLADAAREFNRYNRKKLAVDPATTAAIHVGGTFDAENVDAFVRLMQQAYRLTVEDDGTTVKISGGQKPSH